MRHLWWLFVVNCHGRKDAIECFLQYFSNKWIYQYEPKYNLEARTGEKYIVGVFQADTTRHKRGLRWIDISKYNPVIANWFHYITNKKAAITFCQKAHNRTSGPFGHNLEVINV